MARGHIAARVIRRVERALGDRIPDASAATLIGLAVGPNSDPPSVISAARRLEARGGRAQALRLLREASAHHPTESDLLYELGFLLERDGETQAAVDAYSASIELRPMARNLYRRGRCHQVLGDLASAADDLAHSLRFNQRDFRVHRALLESSQGEPLWRRLEILESAIEATEVDEEWKVTLANVRYAMGHFDKAAVLYAMLDTEHPQDRYGLRHVECLYLAGQHMRARQEFRKRAPTFKSSDHVRRGLGGYLQSLGRWSDAAREYDLALGPSPTPHALHQCGYAYLRAYELGAALPYLSRASRDQMAPASWAFHEGMCLEKMERYADAINAYLWAYGQGGSEYHLYRAVACARLFDSKETTNLVAEYLGQEIAADSRVEEQIPEEGLATRDRMIQALRRGARKPLREIAQRARREARTDQALRIFKWLCDTEDHLHSPDHIELAATYMQIGDVLSGFDAYLGSRPFRTAHGLDENNLPPTLDRNHAIYIEFCEYLPVDSQKVLYESNHGSSLTCNVLPLLRQNLLTDRGRSQEHVVVLNDAANVPTWLHAYENVILVRRGGHAYLRHLATAAWLVNNNTFPPYFSRRSDQRYLNTWHGTPLKALGRDIRSGLMDHRNASRNFLHATHLSMSNLHTARVVVDRYDVSGLYTGKLALTGSPRVDSTVKLDPLREQEIRASLPAKPIVVYAPTWRGTLADRDFDTERLVRDLEALSELPVHLIFKPHPITEELLRDIDLPSHTAPLGVDINELLAVTDVLLTDYSSIFFDYYPLGRPTILYAYDEDDYFRQRGAYFELDKLPGTVCRTIGEVTAVISKSLTSDFGLTPGDIDVSEFCGMEDGGATERVLSFFFEDCEEYVIDSYFSKEDREEILFFSGSFIPNGITNSFTALARRLIDSNRYNVNVVFQPEAVYTDPNRLEKFRELPEGMRAFGRVGTMASTPEEQWLIDRFNSLHGFFSSEHQRLVLRAFEREFYRMFGCAKFSHVVCFEGYARFWVSLLAGAGTRGTSSHIYLHSDMVHEREVRFRYLDGVFALYNTFDSLISVSESVNEVNRSRLSATWGIDPARMVAVRNMIDLAEIRERAASGARLSFPWSNDVKTFVSTGRLTPEKGHELLLEAFANVANSRDDAALIIVGDGPLMAQMKGFVASRGLGDRILLPGYMSNPLGVVSQADCFVFPSRYEGQGLSLVEGLALGLPGIGADVVGIRSVLADGEGLLVELTIESLERGLLAFLDGEELATREFDPEGYVAKAIVEFEAAIKLDLRDSK